MKSSAADRPRSSSCTKDSISLSTDRDEQLHDTAEQMGPQIGVNNGSKMEGSDSGSSPRRPRTSSDVSVLAPKVLRGDHLTNGCAFANNSTNCLSNYQSPTFTLSGSSRNLTICGVMGSPGTSIRFSEVAFVSPPFSTPLGHIGEYFPVPSDESNNVDDIEGNLQQKTSRHRGELTILEKYRYDLSRAQLKASSRTSALLAGFAMVALVELQYDIETSKPLLIVLGVVTTLLVSVHLLALMMSTCILPYIEANGCTQDSPHIRLKFYIDLSWLFSTCIGLVLFLIEIGVIFFVKFDAINYLAAAYVTTALLVPVVVVFTIFSCLIHKNRFIHSMNRVDSKVNDLQKFLSENEAASSQLTKTSHVQSHLVSAGLQGITVVDNK